MRAHCLWVLLLFLAPAYAAIEINAQWTADSPEAVAAAMNVQAFQAGLRRDIGQVYDAAGMPDAGVSVALQATIVGGSATLISTTPPPQTATTSQTQPHTTPAPPDSPTSGGLSVAIGAGVVAVVGLAALGLFSNNRALTVPAARERKGPELPYKIERHPKTDEEEADTPTQYPRNDRVY